MLTFWVRRWDMFKKFQYSEAKSQKKKKNGHRRGNQGVTGGGSQTEKWFWLEVSKEEVVSEICSRLGHVLLLFQNIHTHSKIHRWNWIFLGESHPCLRDWEDVINDKRRRERKQKLMGSPEDRLRGQQTSGVDCRTRIMSRVRRQGTEYCGHSGKRWLLRRCKSSRRRQILLWEMCVFRRQGAESEDEKSYKQHHGQNHTKGLG